MKLSTKLSSVFLLSILTFTNSFGQDDEARSQSGLPTYIGNRPGTNTTPGSDARISGTVEILGMADQNSAPMISVAVLANGVLVARQRIKNKGAYSFTGVPRHGVSLIVEVDNQEIGSYPMGTLIQPPMSNRKDILLTWNQGVREIKNQNEILSLRNSYQRSKENQKGFDKAIASLKDKKIEISLKLFSLVVEKDANDFVAWTELGSLYFIDDEYADSENAYNKALALESSFLPALVNLGKLYLSQKKTDQSIATLTKALGEAPQSADVNQYLGESYLLAKKGSKAVGFLNKALELAPIQKADIHLRLAALYIAAGAKDRAAAEYKMFLEKVPTHPEKAKLEKYVAENTPQ